jgi:hypothetical protein
LLCRIDHGRPAGVGQRQSGRGRISARTGTTKSLAVPIMASRAVKAASWPSNISRATARVPAYVRPKAKVDGLGISGFP